MFPILTISGSPYERGRQHGAALARQVRHSLASYSRLFARRRGLDWAALCSEALGYQALLADVAPDLLEEMGGIAAGAGLELADIVALNVRTELLAGVAPGTLHPDAAVALQRNRLAGLPQHPGDAAGGPQATGDNGECTTVGALPEAAAGATLLAQTWDWSGEQRAACALLRIESPIQPSMLTLTEAGIVAKIGVNSAGVAVSLNILRSQQDGRAPGMPVHVLLRLMLQASSFAEARSLAYKTPAGASSCITVAGDGALASLEITPHRVGELRPEDGLLVHTNHCLDQQCQGSECDPGVQSTTLERYNRATALLHTQPRRISVDLLKAVLSDHHDNPGAICRHPDPQLHPADRVESVTGVVIDIGRRVMYVAAGLPCKTPFTPIALEG